MGLYFLLIDPKGIENSGKVIAGERWCIPGTCHRGRERQDGWLALGLFHRVGRDNKTGNSQDAMILEEDRG